MQIHVNTHQYEYKRIHEIPTNTSNTHDTYQHMIRTDTYQYMQINANTCAIHAIQTNTEMQSRKHNGITHINNS